MGTPVIIDAVRTPLGKRKGWLAGVHPAVLIGQAMSEVLARSGIDSDLVDQVVAGCVTQAGEQSNGMVRRAWLHAGLAQHTGGTMVDAQCGSGQQAAHLVNDMIAAGTIEIGIAAGVEAMSRIPLGANVPAGTGDPRPADWSIDMPNQFEAADRIAKNRGLSRADLDAFGLASQQKARVAVDEGRFKREIAAVTAPVLDAEGDETGETRFVDTDQGLRDTTLEGLAGLKTVLPDGLHTAGTSSQISDGASAVLIMDSDRAAALGLKPRARIVSHCLVGSDPYYHLDGPIEATAEGARPHRHVDLRLRPVRGQRGLRLGRPVLGRSAPGGPGHGQRERRRHRPRPPRRLHRHPADHHRPARARAPRPVHRADLHVRRRRDGDRDGHRADLSGAGLRLRFYRRKMSEVTPATGCRA